MKKVLAAFAFLAALSAGNAAWAHPEHDDVLPQQKPALELSQSDKGPVFHVVSGGKKISTAGAVGVLTIRGGDKTRDIKLMPTGANGMAAKSKAPIGRNVSSRATVTLADKQVVSGEFMIK